MKCTPRRAVKVKTYGDDALSDNDTSVSRLLEGVGEIPMMVKTMTVYCMPNNPRGVVDK